MKFSCIRFAMVCVAAGLTLSATSLTSAQMTTQVYVPPSALVFHNLDSLSKAQVNWKALPTFNKKSSYTNKYTTALNLGKYS